MQHALSRQLRLATFVTRPAVRCCERQEVEVPTFPLTVSYPIGSFSELIQISEARLRVMASIFAFVAGPILSCCRWIGHRACCVRLPSVLVCKPQQKRECDCFFSSMLTFWVEQVRRVCPDCFDPRFLPSPP